MERGRRMEEGMEGEREGGGRGRRVEVKGVRNQTKRKRIQPWCSMFWGFNYSIKLITKVLF